MNTLLDNYAGRAEFEALCEKAKQMHDSTTENLQIEKVMERMYDLLYCLDDLSNNTADYHRSCQYSNAGQMLTNCLDYMRNNIFADRLARTE